MLEITSYLSQINREVESACFSSSVYDGSNRRQRLLDLLLDLYMSTASCGCYDSMSLLWKTTAKKERNQSR